MCGIGGILSFDGCEVTERQLQPLINHQRHRGPDGEDTWTKNNVGLAHTRLSIIDLSIKAQQPIADCSGRFVCVFNGELYNYKSLRKTLESNGQRFFSNGDSEVVPNAINHWGFNAFQRFDGMFAAAIWDKHEQKLILARDRLGKKPLYYTIQKGRLVFASEIQALYPFMSQITANREAIARST